MFTRFDRIFSIIFKSLLRLARYDIFFRQGVMVFTDKRWNSLDLAIWIQCYRKSNYVSKNTSTMPCFSAKRAVSSAQSQRLYYAYYGGQRHRENCIYRYEFLSCERTSHPLIKCQIVSKSKRKESPLLPSSPPRRLKNSMRLEVQAN